MNPKSSNSSSRALSGASAQRLYRTGPLSVDLHLKAPPSSPELIQSSTAREW